MKKRDYISPFYKLGPKDAVWDGVKAFLCQSVLVLLILQMKF